MGSGSQAQLAASQAASAEQLKAFEEALAFQKDIFAKSQAQRAPYIQAGTSSLAMLMGLLGLQTQASGENPKYKPSPTAGGPSAGGPTTKTTTSPTQTTKSPSGGMTDYTYPTEGYPRDPLTGTQGQSTDLTTLTSGGQQYDAPLNDPGGGMVKITNQQGDEQLVPANLVPFYTAKGWST